MFAIVWEADAGFTDLKLSHEYFKSRMPVRSILYLLYTILQYRLEMRLNKK